MPLESQEQSISKRMSVAQPSPVVPFSERLKQASIQAVSMTGSKLKEGAEMAGEIATGMVKALPRLAYTGVDEVNLAQSKIRGTEYKPLPKFNVPILGEFRSSTSKLVEAEGKGDILGAFMAALQPLGDALTVYGGLTAAEKSVMQDRLKKVFSEHLGAKVAKKDLAEIEKVFDDVSVHPLKTTAESPYPKMSEMAGRGNLDDLLHSPIRAIQNPRGIAEESFLKNSVRELVHDGRKDLALKLAETDFSGVKNFDDLASQVVGSLGHKEAMSNEGIINWLNQVREFFPEGLKGSVRLAKPISQL